MRFLKYLFVLIVAYVGILGIILGWPIISPWRYDEFNDINKKLTSIPGLKILKAGGNEDITFEDIYVTVELKGIVMTFQQLTRNSFYNPDSLIISRIGPYIPTTRGCSHLRFSNVKKMDGKKDPERFYGTSIDIGKRGDFSGISPTPYKNIQDVLSRSKELVKILQSWPTTPDEKYLGGSQKIYTYWNQRDGTDGYEGPWKDLLSISNSTEKLRNNFFTELRDPNWEQYCTST